jgi:hypothetical protein
MSIKCSEVVNFNLSLGYFNLISEIIQEQVKYIRGYKLIMNDYFQKVFELQKISGMKLGKVPANFEKSTWLDSAPLIKLTQQIPKIIQKHIEKVNDFVNGIEPVLKQLESFYKNKSLEIKKFQKNYENSNATVIKKYIETEKTKDLFMNSISKSEDLILNCCKKKMDGIKNEVENSKKDKTSLEQQKKNSIIATKRYESNYKDIINKTIEAENDFLTAINEAIKGLKDINSDGSEILKYTIEYFLNSIKGSYKVPLDLIESSLASLGKLKQKEVMMKAMEDTFNNQQKLVNITSTRYNLKTLEIIKDERDSNASQNSYNSKNTKNAKNYEEMLSKKYKGFVKFEDGFEEMSYFEDDVAFLTVKELFQEFELINHNGLDIQKEEEKNEVKNIINRLLASISVDSNKNNIALFNLFNYKSNILFSENDKKNLTNLLTKHQNRAIFLHKLNDYRTCSLFEITPKGMDDLIEIFISVVDSSRKEKDFHCIEMSIILSKTYYKKENDKKIYIQKALQDLPCFKEKSFWDELLEYSISKDIISSSKINKELIIADDAKKEKDDNIVFSQLLSIIDNMSDFEVDGNIIKEVIEPKILSYKISEKLKNTIYEVIEAKMKEKNQENK